VAKKQIDDLKADKSHLRGKLSQLTGKFAEYQLLTEFRSKKRFPRKGVLRNPYQPISTAWWTSAN